jgi:hypothetical protein
MSLYASGSSETALLTLPSDSTLIGPFNALYVGGAGNVAVTTINGQVVTFTAVPVGTILPIRGTKVMATNTTATFILALW